MKNLPEKIIFSLIALVIISWCGFHFYKNSHTNIEVETAFEYTLTHFAETSGIVIRDEVIIDDIYDENLNYLFKDSERVSKGQVIAEYYKNKKTDKNYDLMQEISQEISLLNKAQEKDINNFSNLDTINRDLRSYFRSIDLMTNSGSYINVKPVKTSITHLLNRRQIASNKEENYNALINELSEQLGTLKSETEDDVLVCKTPVSGYFTKKIDGYENIINSKDLKTYSASELVKLIEEEEKTYTSNKVGKIVKTPKWYYAAVFTEKEAENVYTGKEVTIEFMYLDTPVPATVYATINDIKNEKVVIIFICDLISEDTINLRKEPANVIFDKYTGYRIPVAARRFVDGVEGVYVLHKGVVKFKKINSIYEDGSFIISAPLVQEDLNDIESVQHYDQIIVKGTDLYNGKPVQ